MSSISRQNPPESLGLSAYPSPTSLPTLSLPDSPASSKPRRAYRFSTKCATVDNPEEKDQYGSSSVPIYQTATFKGLNGRFDYTRSGNPTRSHLQHHLAKIYSAQHAFTVSSGMAALDVITRLLKAGDEVIAGDDLYGGTNRLLTYLKEHNGVTVHHVDTTDPEFILPLVKHGKTAMVLLESPTNPLLKIADLELIANYVHRGAPDALVVVDNTMMSPYLQRPLEIGADIVYDSGTKYLSGHHDLMAGVITCNREDIGKQIGFIINAVGNALSPFDSFLLLRGIKTLAIRMDRQQRSAMAVASFLDRLGFKVHYPGLKNHPGKGIHDRLASGPGAVLSFVTGDVALSERIVGATRLWGISVSFGAVNSLISMPCVMSHASIDPAVRAARGLPEDLIRLCVGIEDPEDLIDDLENAIVEAGITLPSPLPSIAEPPSTPIRGEPWAPRLSLAAPLPLMDMEKRKPTHAHWFVSAPGKVILFGEHAVVHGVTAIGACVDLRCYALASHRDDGKVSLHLPDLNNWRHAWDIESLPWDAVTPTRVGEDHGPILDARLMDAIDTRALPDTVNLPQFLRAKAAVTAFLYIYMILRQDGKPKPSFNFVTRSTLPIGAGLGSSASYSACVASVNLIFARRTSLNEPVRRRLNSEAAISYVIKHDGRRAIPSEVAEEVNKWAFVAEKVMHGNPSGVDNTVSVHGGATAYKRAVNGAKGGMDGLHGFRSVKFLLTDSQVPRDTKKLVANVGLALKQNPNRGADILDSIQAISTEGFRALSDPEIPRETLLNGLSKLIKQNHAFLKELGASHISLEEICELTDEFGLCTKLTGAGGGGCAVTLIPDDFYDDSLKILVDKLTEAGYRPYLTTVGGSGLGVYPVVGDPSPEEREELKAAFVEEPRDNLAKWAEKQGGWLYV
ncbi:hypothetical protein M408DRAFT_326161 [Serendipita vermifera MAFF 305830]|uniref:Cystathionine beta-lyase n=1 Tax=Serendipita vermifera MAFF 305830 TaxID=933852 RepID=A0A0C2XX55_SERVB|nr:hypothetical protein M408DRAFT_326161 [Serendipita vermifera MAFF 305830]